MSNSTTCASASKAVNTTEVLEAILVKLPPLDLLICKRVNTKFRDTINSSNNIQKRLFLKADPNTNSRVARANPFLPRIARRFLQESEVEVACPDDLNPGDETDNELDDTPNDGPNPLDDVAVFDFDDADYLWVTSTDDPYMSVEMWADSWKASAVLPKSASWMNMLAADPPCLFDIEYTPDAETLRYDHEHRKKWTPTTVWEVMKEFRDIHRRACREQHSRRAFRHLPYPSS